ncbi:unnamed protein product [Lota lota]
MGCSSSSAQVVDEEKRPVSKLAESNGNTVGKHEDVSNGTIAEDAQSIENQVLLPGQTALPEGYGPSTEDEAEDVLMGLEAEEDLGSGEDLLAAPAPEQEPKQEPNEEPAPSDEPAASQTTATIVKAVLPLEEAGASEPAGSDAPSEVEAIVESTEEVLKLKHLCHNLHNLKQLNKLKFLHQKEFQHQLKFLHQ